MQKSNIVNVLLIAALILLVVNISEPLQQSLGGQKKWFIIFSYSSVTTQGSHVNRYPTGNYGYTNVTVVLQNNEDFEVHGTATVTLKTYQNPTGTVATSDLITLPAHQTVTTIVPFSRLPFDPAFASFVTFTAQETVPSTPTTSSGTSGSNVFTRTPSGHGGASFDYSSLTLPISAVAIVVLCAVGGVVVLRKEEFQSRKLNVSLLTSFRIGFYNDCKRIQGQFWIHAKALKGSQVKMYLFQLSNQIALRGCRLIFL